jgi:NAD(P)-dependent dehydrogenase (short-subunit alcohol dehydrogenase family)
MLLQSRSGLVTGAAQGMGLAIGREFATQHATVVLVDVDADRAAESAAQLRSDGLLTAATVVEVTGGRHAWAH